MRADCCRIDAKPVLKAVNEYSFFSTGSYIWLYRGAARVGKHASGQKRVLQGTANCVLHASCKSTQKGLGQGQ